MNRRESLLVALPMGGVAWAGLAWLVLTQPPTDLTLGVALLLLGVAAASTALPVILTIHGWQRKPRRPVRATVVWRQAVWVGVFVALCAILQLARVLDTLLALALAVALGLLESFWQRRT